MKKHFVPYLFFLACLSPSMDATDAKVSVTEPSLDTALLLVERTLGSERFHDLDGDGRADRIDWVTLAPDIDLQSLTIPVVTPWENQDESQEGGSHHKLLITFGDSRQLIVHDRNAISVLDTEAVQDMDIISRMDLPSLDLPDLVNMARGDVILIPTEAGIDTYLYWDGETLGLYEPLELP